jgi:hypothetical protein
MLLWGTASTSNIEILGRFQSKALRVIVDAPWYVPDAVSRRDLQIPTVKGEIRRYSSQCSAYQISSVIVEFVILVFKTWSRNREYGRRDPSRYADHASPSIRKSWHQLH